MADILKIKQEMQDVLHENILRFWLDNMQDTENGGFYGQMTGDGRIVKDAPKGGILNARILWSFSAAFRVTGREEYLMAAIRAKGKKAGVVIKPKTPAEAVLPFINEVDMILVMTVEPGFGGQKFMADMMPKVEAIRGYIDAQNPACELEVDGGVDPVTCKACIAAGANVLVAGSAVYKAEDIPGRIAELRG